MGSEIMATFAKKYPENVYLAQGNYDGKIILTRLGKREILDKFDEKKIVEFITQWYFYSHKSYIEQLLFSPYDHRQHPQQIKWIIRPRLAQIHQNLVHP